jgi:hypothetical protein
MEVAPSSKPPPKIQTTTGSLEEAVAVEGLATLRVKPGEDVSIRQDENGKIRLQSSLSGKTAAKTDSMIQSVASWTRPDTKGREMAC